MKQKRTTDEYNKEHYVQIKFRLNKQKDAELIQHLKSRSNLTAYIKMLVALDMSMRAAYGDK